MAKRKTYADNLRDALLALALVPVAGLHTASFWFKESLERTSRLATEIVTTTALARSATATDSKTRPAGNDPIADVLAQDLIAAVQTYVRSMVKLPGDSAIYFTGELERNLTALLLQIQPDAETDPATYIAGELEPLGQEVDRLLLIARGAAQHPRNRSRAASGRMTESETSEKLLKNIDGLRTSVQRSTKELGKLLPSDQTAFLSRGPAASRRLRVLNTQKARATLQDALSEVEALLPGHKQKRSFRKVRSAIKDLDGLAKNQLTSSRPASVKR